MRLPTRRKRVLAVLAILAIAMLIWTGGTATAKKPVKPPPPPPDPGDTGVVYFWHWGVGGLTEMEPDGSDKVAITPTDFVDWGAPPSRALHGGERWWLNRIRAEGSHPDGSWRYHLYAIGESGKKVQLTHADTLQLNHTGAWPEWAKDGTVVDGKISFLGKRWVYDAAEEAWVVSEWGLYVATLDPSDLPTSSSLSLSWTCHDIGLEALDSSAGLYEGTLFGKYDWSPDGLSIAYSDEWDPGIHRADHDPASGTWTVTRLTTTGEVPRWSPDATKLAFTSTSGIEIMSASNGTGRVMIVEDPPDKGNLSSWLENVSWSPNGTHLTYVFYKYDTRKHELKDSDVLRVKADGSGELNLTSDTDNRVSWAYWRDE